MPGPLELPVILGQHLPGWPPAPAPRQLIPGEGLVARGVLGAWSHQVALLAWERHLKRLPPARTQAGRGPPSRLCHLTLGGLAGPRAGNPGKLLRGAAASLCPGEKSDRAGKPLTSSARPPSRQRLAPGPCLPTTRGKLGEGVTEREEWTESQPRLVGCGMRLMTQGTCGRRLCGSCFLLQLHILGELSAPRATHGLQVQNLLHHLMSPKRVRQLS